jgi:hypothetical protein
VLLTLTVTAVGQQPTSLVASVSGEGTIKLGKEEFKIHAIVVKLFEDGKAEINLITDITVFVEGSWSRSSETSKDLDLKITGNSMSNNMEGGGKLYLSEDRKSITGLKLEVLNKTSRKVIKADFVAK